VKKHKKLKLFLAVSEINSAKPSGDKLAENSDNKNTAASTASK